MTRERYEDVARILGGKKSRKLIRAHLAGKLQNVSYELTYGSRLVNQRSGMLGRKTTTHKQKVHEYRLDLEWLDQPVHINWINRGIEIVPALRSEMPKATLEQQVILTDAHFTWPSLVATNMGYEVVIDDNEQTAQELAVVLQAMVASLSSLAPADTAEDVSLNAKVRGMVDRLRPDKS